ncbi:MAG: hypothetical protein ACU0B9_07350 [Limimaricola soesokkakensis]|uniref:hypothetical protein n=1 Tax=Limimaricola soesokkakensis TaxID=1343159 RepID=UPI00405A3DCC
MKLGNAFTGLIPIESHTRRREDRPAPEPVPEAGVLFGRPSTFSFSAAGAEPGPAGEDGDKSTGPRFVVKLPDDGPPEYRRIIRAAAAVISEEARTESAQSADSWVDVDRFELLRLSFTEYPAKPTLSSLQPTIRVEYDLRFKLHPETETKL